MQNGKTIAITSLVIGVLLLTGGYFLTSGKKTAQYGYELTGQVIQTGTTTMSGKTTVATGTIMNPTSVEVLAYINTWNGDVMRERK